jgi:hypothetical protein
VTGQEAKIEQYLREQVEGAGGVCLKFTGTKRGVPDRVIVLNGLTVFVELKAPKGGKVSAHQDRMFRKIMAAGGFVFLINTKDQVDDFIVFMLQDDDTPQLILPDYITRH